VDRLVAEGRATLSAAGSRDTAAPPRPKGSLDSDVRSVFAPIVLALFAARLSAALAWLPTLGRLRAVAISEGLPLLC
jgi:hypothetical protein